MRAEFFALHHAQVSGGSARLLTVDAQVDAQGERGACQMRAEFFALHHA